MRRAAIAAEIATGEVSLQTVADRYGITRERVRQIAVAEGVTVRGGYIAQVKRTHEKYKVLAQESLTKSDEEIAQESGVGVQTVKAARRTWGINRLFQKGYRANGDYHGTMNGYSNHGCRCELCRAKQRQEYLRHVEQARLEGPPTHGNSGYTNYGCRCTICKAANSEYQRRQHERRKAQRQQAG